MMARVFGEWRGGHTRNRGGLVWFFKDLWPAAGWGVVDSLGVPKAAYYYLRRAWLSRQIAMTDEGLDGLHLHVTNETAEPLYGTVELLLLDGTQTVVARQETACGVEPRGQRTIASDELLGGFFDVTYAYRFGPPRHQVAIATLFDDERRVLSEAFHFVTPREPAIVRGAGVEVEAEAAGGGRYHVTLRCDHFLQGASLEAGGFLPDDNYFHLPPSRTKLVRFTPLGDRRDRFRATLQATNLEHPVRVRIRETPRQDTDHA
jgi:beta-mannosidase